MALMHVVPDSSRGMLNNAFLRTILHVQQQIHYASWVAIIVRCGWCVDAHCYLSVFARPFNQLMLCRLFGLIVSKEYFAVFDNFYTDPGRKPEPPKKA